MESDRERGAHPRPHTRWLPCETGATWLDLVATVRAAYGPAPVERLESPGHLFEWLSSHGLRPVARPTKVDLIRARGLRESLRGLALATVRGEPRSAKDLAFLNEVLAEDLPLKLGAGASKRLEMRPPMTPREALARIAREAATHLAGPAAATLHTCADADCGMLFLDPSGRRKWCTTEICGVRNRVRAHRRRCGADA